MNLYTEKTIKTTRIYTEKSFLWEPEKKLYLEKKSKISNILKNKTNRHQILIRFIVIV